MTTVAHNTDTVSTSPIALVPNTGLYRISYYIQVLNPALAGILTYSSSWTDPATSRTHLSPGISIAGYNKVEGEYIVYDTGTTCTGQISIVSLLGTVSYEYWITREQIG